MKLPEWKEREGTSMAGAYVSAARVGDYGKVQPNLRNFTPQRNVRDEAQMELAKGNQYAAILSGVTNAYDAYAKIKTAEESMSLKAAQTEYKNHMASWVADLEVNANKPDEATGLARWETAKEDYATASETAKDAFLSKYRLDPDKMNKSSKLEWGMNTSTVDTNYQNKLTGVEAKQLSFRALESFRTGMEGASSLSEAQQTTSAAIQTGAVDYDVAMEELGKWEQGNTFDTVVQSMPGQSMEAALSVQQEMISDSSDRSKLLTNKQRQGAAKAGALQVENLHRQKASAYYQRGGSAAVMQYIKDLDRAGPKGSYTVDQVSHDALITELTARANQLKTREKAVAVDQTYDSVAESYFNGNDETDYSTYVTLRNDKGARDKLDDVTLELAKSPDFYENPTVGQVIRRGAEVNYITSPIVDRIEIDVLNDNNLSKAVAIISAAEDINPHAFDSMAPAAEQKYKYAENYISSGLLDESDPQAYTKLNAGYSKYQNLSENDIKGINATAKYALDDKTGTSVAKRFERSAYEMGYTDNDTFSPDAVISDFDIQQTYTQAWAEAYRMNRNEGSADRAAFKAAMSVAGATTSYGTSTPITERNSPEAVLSTPGRPQGAPSEWIDKQHTESIGKLNEGLVANNMRPVTVQDTRRQYLGPKAGPNGEPAWLLVDYGGKAVVGASGKNVMLTYSPIAPNENDNSVKLVQTSKFSAMSNQQDYIVNKHSLALPDNGSTLQKESLQYGSVPLDRDQTPAEFNRVNRHDWKRMSDEKRGEAQLTYFATYNALMAANQQEAARSGVEFKEQDVDFRVRNYLSSQGYMHGDDTGKYVPPPEIK